MSFDHRMNGPVFNDYGQQVGQYNAYTNTVTVNYGVQSAHNQYLSIGPGTYNVGYQGQIGPNPTAPLGHIGPNGLIRFER